MSNKPWLAEDLPRTTMAMLMLAVLSMSAGYGVVLPLLPYLIERLLDARMEVAQVSRYSRIADWRLYAGAFPVRPLLGTGIRSARSRKCSFSRPFRFGITMIAISSVESLARSKEPGFIS